jgi:hypothetical protein
LEKLILAETAAGQKKKTMTNKIRRTEIQIEIHEVKIIRRRGKRRVVYCEQCQAEVTAFTLEQTAAFFQLTLTEVCRFVGDNQIHLVSSRRGVPLVCAGSLGNENEILVPKASPNQL